MTSPIEEPMTVDDLEEIAFLMLTKALAATGNALSCSACQLTEEFYRILFAHLGEDSQCDPHAPVPAGIIADIEYLRVLEYEPNAYLYQAEPRPSLRHIENLTLTGLFRYWNGIVDHTTELSGSPGFCSTCRLSVELDSLFAVLREITRVDQYDLPPEMEVPDGVLDDLKIIIANLYDPIVG